NSTGSSNNNIVMLFHVLKVLFFLDLVFEILRKFADSIANSSHSWLQQESIIKSQGIVVNSLILKRKSSEGKDLSN
ncbi:MAG TPA: hypothetical protein VF842_06715, partial [Flavobacterium sp.]